MCIRDRYMGLTGNIHHGLHTPLVSLTVALTGIVVLGCMYTLQYIGLAGWLSITGVIVAAITIVAGLMVTKIVLDFFREETLREEDVVTEEQEEEQEGKSSQPITISQDYDGLHTLYQ
eukprot:TRINITY_DN8514_c0_g2_i3.p2 TRINITY_DN8514_c0_g2~~TRINITY_DN8514_c0_g2_i3.p2  ORF type:complete len:118 (-),score=13.16 TRINITY_DN8514_c0_g2_i3:207-560(-)